jgi:hypothetical protein
MLQLMAIFTLLALIPVRACSGGAVAERRALSRAFERKAESGMASTLKRDLKRDLATTPKSLTKDRYVYRYTTAARARAEAGKGLAAGTHVTSRISPGRPLSAARAKTRYGLPVRPQVREKVLINKGLSVRVNKALGGERGVGEITVVKPTGKTAVQGMSKLK